MNEIKIFYDVIENEIKANDTILSMINDLKSIENKLKNECETLDKERTVKYRMIYDLFNELK